jgi:environmental stress-induced protein Ves
MNFFSIDQLPCTPWKNGGGTTREIMSWPPGADFTNFEWRVSVATISASGPFSKFEGIDRVIMLLDGDGVRLHGAGIDWRLDRAQEPFAFSGDDQISSELLGGESTDFNVMTRRKVAAARVEVIESSGTVASQDAGLVMCLSGSWLVDQQPVKKGQGFWWTGGAQVAFNRNSPSRDVLVLVSWTRL